MRLFYGWWLMLTLGITETLSWGVLYYAFVAYQGPMSADMGWSRGETSGAFSLALLVSGLSAIPVGAWLDRFGARLLMTLGSIAATGLVLAWSRVTTLPQLYVLFALIGITMAATLYDPAFATANRWFDKHRVRALTLITVLAGFASTVFIPLANLLIQTQGWRQSLVTLAIILAVGTIAPHALLLRRQPQDIGLHPDGAEVAAVIASGSSATGLPKREAFRHASFRWLVLAFCLATLTTIAVGVHFLPYLEERGFDPAFAASMTGLIGAMQVLARLVMAPFGGRTSARLFAATMFALQPLALLVLLLVRSTVGICLFVVLFGAARGLSTIARPALVADLYGRTQYASIAGVLQFTVSLAQAVAPFGAGAAFDLTRSYEPILWTLLGLSVLAVLAVLPARRERTNAVQSGG